tara:strand:- start:94 stop:228 length:135 start_codon:yes stop_codon:yes gene_type:complete
MEEAEAGFAMKEGVEAGFGWRVEVEVYPHPLGIQAIHSSSSLRK